MRVENNVIDLSKISISIDILYQCFKGVGEILMAMHITHDDNGRACKKQLSFLCLLNLISNGVASIYVLDLHEYLQVDS